MKRERLDHYTENAIRATEAGKLIPPIVYLPRSLRRGPARLTVQNLALTIDPPTVEENHVKIADADPVSFLIAIMHGQPIPSFRVTRDGGVEVFYEVADLTMRKQVAEYLGHKATIRTINKPRDKQRSADHDAMVARVGASLQAHNDESDD